MIESLLALVVVVAASVYVLLRHKYVNSVRDAILADYSLYCDVFIKLPSYEDMLWHPRHQLRWSKEHWVRYARTA